MSNEFRTPLGQQIFKDRYAQTRDETWAQRTKTIVKDVCGRRDNGLAISSHPLMAKDELSELEHLIRNFIVIPGGRYIYYAGREVPFYSNCYLFRAEEDTREEWGRLLHAHSDALMSGGGTGCDYSRLRPKGTLINRTGGIASGPLALMKSLNEVGRNVRQGGSRRSALLASLNWQHGDINEFLNVKDWAAQKVPGLDITYAQAKHLNFDFPAPLDGTNLTVNYDDDWGFDPTNPTFLSNVRQGCKNGEPGLGFNFGPHRNETLRNACGELTSSDDSDSCNLCSINMANCPDLDTFKEAIYLGSKFLVCGTLRGLLPDKKMIKVREQSRRLGLGLMGMHEWLLHRNYRYDPNEELAEWLEVYRTVSEKAANEHADRFYISRPVGYRAIAPNGTIGILAGTSSGIEPIYAVAYKRRWIDKEQYRYKIVIDQTAKDVIDHLGIEDPDSIETSMDLAKDVERRIAFQAFVQGYVDHAISSTINLPAWGTEHNNEHTVETIAKSIAHHAPRLRGLTFYPDGARGGQPITRVPYKDAIGLEDVIFEENDQCVSGVCGI